MIDVMLELKHKDDRLAELDRKLYLAEDRIKQLEQMIINERVAYDLAFRTREKK